MRAGAFEGERVSKIAHPLHREIASSEPPNIGNGRWDSPARVYFPTPIRDRGSLFTSASIQWRILMYVASFRSSKTMQRDSVTS